jgi:sulfate adenylyltransferase subunit 1
MELLETIAITDQNDVDFRFPVQYVNRPHLNFRGFAGTIVSGAIAVGEEITVLPSGKASKVKTITTFDGDLAKSEAPNAVTITLEDEIDISRGDMLVKADSMPMHGNLYKTHLVWMSEDTMIPNKQYSFKFASKVVNGSIANIDHKIDVNTMAESEALHLNLNEIGVVDIRLTQAVATDAYADNRATGAFIVIDRLTNGTVGAGMIISENVAKQSAGKYSEFELEFNALVRKHFPHWGTADITQL